MANNLKSMIKVVANEDAIARLNECLDKCETGDITSFANAFYDNVEVSENGGVMNSWSLDNLGSKWNYLYDAPYEDEFYIESAWYPPMDFFKHLYKMLSELDPDVVIEVKYEDEGYDPIGAVVIKKDVDGTPCSWQEEDDEIEDPTIDMDWDDENYDLVQMEFMESIADRQDELLAECHRLVESDGEPIYELEEE